MQTDSTLLENSPLNIADTSTLPHSEAQHYGLDSNSFTDNSISTIQPEQIIYIDSAVKDYQVLIDSLNQPTEVILLDSQQDGLVQISESLQQYQGVEFEAIHIVSHGDIGELFLGNTSLKQDNLDNYQDVLSSWSDLITADGDILLYGCNVGADLAGAEFLETFSQYTQADILASTDLTGSEDLGGDWDLEFAVGEIEAESAFDDSIGNDYQSALVGSNFDLSVNPIFNDYLDTNFPVTGGGFNFVFNNDLIDAGLNLDSNFQTVSPGQLNNIFDVDLDTYNYANPGYNSILFGFSPSTFNFDSTNFNFSSMTMDSKYITFDFEPADFNFNFGDGLRDSMDFGYRKSQFKFDSMFEFDSRDVRFDKNSVRFEYDDFDFSRQRLFESHTNLLDYKFTESEILSLEGNDEIRFAQQLNASDYRAMRYGFDGDFMFDSDYYIKEYDFDLNINPFTNYVENGVEFDINPNAVFDTSFYNSNNPDVAASVRTGLEDYMGGGWRIGLIGDPNYDPEQNTDFNAFFSSEDYFTIHDDVRVESYDPEANSPLEDLMDFGFVEGRITSEIALSDDVFSFSTIITSDSEGFEIVQDKIRTSNIGVQVFPGDDGEVLIASASDEIGSGGGVTVGGIVYSVIVGTTLSIIEVNRLQNELETKLLIQTGELVKGLFENITLSPADPFEIDQVVPSFVRDIFRFPGATEGEIVVVKDFPGSDAITFNGDNIFTTPLEPITDLDSPNVFPERDEILEEILEGPFVFPEGEGLFQPFFDIAGGIFSANDKNLDVINDLGLARELKVARLIGGTKVVQPGRPKVDYRIQDPNNVNIGLQIDVAGPNNELILVGGGIKASPTKVKTTLDRIKTLNKVAISRGVTPQAYFADNTPQSLLNSVAAEIGQQNVFVFPEVLNSERAELSQLEIISDVIDFNK